MAERDTKLWKAIVNSRAARKITKRSEFLDALRGLSAASSEDDWEAARSRLVSTFLAFQLRREIEVAQRPTGMAADLLEPEHAMGGQLKRTPHLGCLAPLAPVPGTRADYARLWCDAALLLKQQHPGLGLGSAAKTSSKEQLKWRGKTVSGLEVIELWIVITNWGHLFGTFATERALLFHLAKDRERREELLHAIAPALRSPCARILSTHRLNRFFYVLAAWRIFHRAGAENAKFLSAVYEMFLEDGYGDQATRLRWAFRKSRQIAMLRMHGLLGLRPIWQLPDRSELIASLLPGGGVLGNVQGLPEPRVNGLLESLQSYQIHSFFSSPEAAALVLHHLRQFKEWWRSSVQSGRELSEVLTALESEPDDWPSSTPATRSHFARFELPSPEPQIEWLNEVRRWQSDQTGAAWEDDNFLITPSERTLLCDVYTSGDPHPAALAATARAVAAHTKASWAAERSGGTRRLWLSAAQFGLAALSRCLAAGSSAALKPVGAGDRSVGLAIIAESLDSAHARALTFIDRCDEKGRASELSAVMTAAQTAHGIEEPAPVLLFLGRVLILREELQMYEFDGLWAQFRRDAVLWYAYQCKASKSRGGQRQAEALADLLTVPTTSPEKAWSPGQRVFETTFSWPSTKSL